MSQQARDDLVVHLVFQDETQKSDLESETLTQTTLIALLQELVAKDWNIEITAVRTDHHDDSALGLHSHANGYCVDCWPLADATPGNYLDASDPRFQQFLADCATAPYLFQIGLAGSADTYANRVAAGHTVFEDTGADHVHLGSS